jgi:predicted amidophosphoribosyltransferase
VIDHAVQRLAERIGDSPLRTLLDESVLLVPTPRRAPLVKGGLWPAHRICEELVRRELAASISPIVERTVPTPKSAFAIDPKDRLKAAEHYATMAASRPLGELPVRVVVVDDFVTRGATMLATASHVGDIFPHAEISAFSLVRSLSQGEVENIIAPCLEMIRLTGDDCFRRA